LLNSINNFNNKDNKQFLSWRYLTFIKLYLLKQFVRYSLNNFSKFSFTKKVIKQLWFLVWNNIILFNDKNFIANILKFKKYIYKQFLLCFSYISGKKLAMSKQKYNLIKTINNLKSNYFNLFLNIKNKTIILKNKWKYIIANTAQYSFKYSKVDLLLKYNFTISKFKALIWK
jgi:hypothetical protein